MKILIKKVCIIILVTLSVSCFQKVEQEMLIGTYVFNEENCIDTIIILPNKKYIHKYKSNYGKNYKSYGNWKYDSNLKEIDFHDFVFYNDEGGDIPGLWIPKVIKTRDGEIRLIYSSENEIYYKKLIMTH